MMWYEQMLSNLVAPFQWVFSSFGDGIAGVWDGYINLVGAAHENKELKKENALLKGKLTKMEEVKSENGRLRNLLDYRDVFGMESVVSRVVANDPRAEFKSIMINRGAKDGIKLYMPVVGPKGLIGRIGRVTNGSAQVCLLYTSDAADE